MQTLLRLIYGVDISVYSWLSTFHGNWFLDRMASHLEGNNLFKSGLMISLYWYFWFREGQDQRERRNTILTILIGTLAGLVVAREVASLAPFRVRPMYDPNLQQHSFSIPISSTFVNWSSFPSDHAAYLGALGFGLIRLCRRLTIPIVLFVSLWICLPRMYLGIHYASDILAGAMIGVAMVCGALKTEAIRSKVARPLLVFMDTKPQVFYAAAFLILFEMAVLFWDIRGPVLALLHRASTIPHSKVLAVGLILIASLVGMGILVRRRLRVRGPHP